MSLAAIFVAVVDWKESGVEAMSVAVVSAIALLGMVYLARNGRKHILDNFFELLFGIFVLIGLFAVIGDELNNTNRAKAQALAYVQTHLVPTARFYSLSPDLASEAWSVKSRFLNCPGEDNRCAEVRYSVNFMEGVEVKQIVCLWHETISKGKEVSATPENTETRLLCSEQPSQ